MKDPKEESDYIKNLKKIPTDEYRKLIYGDFNDKKEQEYDHGDQLIEDNRISETITAMNHPNFFEE